MGALVLAAVPAAIAMTHLDAVGVNNNLVLPDALVLELAAAARARQFVKMTMMKPAAQSLIPQMKISGNEVTTWALPEGAIARLGRGSVQDIAFSPQGHHLAVGTTVGIWWYSLASKLPFALSETERGMVTAISFSDDGRWFAAGNIDGVLKVWDIQPQVCAERIMGETQVSLQMRSTFSSQTRPTFSPDGHHLALLAEGFNTIDIVNPATGEHVAGLGDNTPVKKIRRPAGKLLAFSPDNRLLANVNSTEDMSRDFVTVWDIESGVCIARISEHSDFVYGLCFSPCGGFLAVGYWGGILRVWDIFRGTLELVRTDYGKYRMYPAYSPTGELLAAGLYQYEHQKVVQVWHVAQAEQLDTIQLLRGKVRLVQFSQGGNQVAVASSSELKVWTKPDDTAATQVSFAAHQDTVESIAFSRDGHTLVAGYRWDNVALWDVARQQSQRVLEEHPPCRTQVVHASPDAKIFTVSIHENILKVWDIQKGELCAEMSGPERPGAWTVSLSPQAELLVSGYKNGMLIVWDVQSGQKLHILRAHTDRIQSAAFSPDGKRLASASWDRTVRLWNVENGKEVGRLPIHPSLAAAEFKAAVPEILRAVKPLSQAEKQLRPRRIEVITFSPCGRWIAGGVIEEIRLWDAMTHEIHMAILLPDGCKRPFALAFSSCGRYLASGSWWRGTEKVSIRLWAVANGENIATFRGHPTDVQCLAFSPNGALLASGSYDGTILLWDVKPYLQNETS